MIAQIPLEYAFADALYAAGLGLLLAAIYTCVRMLVPNVRIALFICDLGVFVVAAVLYQSIAIARFYSGITRWYTIFALVLGYASWQLVAHSKFVYLARLIKYLLVLPFIKLVQYAIMPFITHLKAYLKTFNEKRRKKRTQRSKNKTKQLQKPQQVLYNSK